MPRAHAFDVFTPHRGDRKKPQNHSERSLRLQYPVITFWQILYYMNKTTTIIFAFIFLLKCIPVF